jgi:hypothetical protein
LLLAGFSKLFQWLWVRKGAYPRVEHLEGASFRQAPAFLTTIRLGYKSVPRTNIPA